MRLFHFLLSSILILAIYSHNVNSAKILSAAFMSSKSHKITYETLLMELVKRGHEVTVLAPFISGKKIDNLIEYKTIDFEEFMEKGMSKAGIPNFFEMKERGESLNPFMMVEPFEKLCGDSYALPQVQKVMSQKFDLVIMPGLFNECMAGFIHKLNTTLIIVSPVSAPSWVSGLLGSPSPPSFIANMFGGFGQRMNFFERVKNFAMNVMITGMQDFYFKPRMETLYRKELGDASIPSADDVMRNASLIISNSHFSISPIRPFMPDIVEVGGMHLSPAKALPKDLEAFVQGAGDDGFILFSMGSALKGSTMPDKYRKIFLNTFGKLKQKVLWKWETETMEGLPPNVKLSKWLPQQDVLGHPKIKLFITHGGMGSTAEAIYHGVPLLGIPMFGDQVYNMAKNVDMGYALSLELVELSETLLYDSIQEMLKNQSYTTKVKKLSTLLRDQPNNPLDRAVFWTEYVLRHKGAMHLRSPARDLNIFQYHSIDVIAFIFGVIFLVLFLIYKTFAFILCKLCGGKKKKTVANGKKSN